MNNHREREPSLEFALEPRHGFSYTIARVPGWLERDSRLTAIRAIRPVIIRRIVTPPINSRARCGMRVGAYDRSRHHGPSYAKARLCSGASRRVGGGEGGGGGGNVGGTGGTNIPAVRSNVVIAPSSTRRLPWMLMNVSRRSFASARLSPRAAGTSVAKIFRGGIRGISPFRRHSRTRSALLLISFCSFLSCSLSSRCRARQRADNSRLCAAQSGRENIRMSGRGPRGYNFSSRRSDARRDEISRRSRESRENSARSLSTVLPHRDSAALNRDFSRARRAAIFSPAPPTFKRGVYDNANACRRFRGVTEAFGAVPLSHSRRYRRGAVVAGNRFYGYS